MGVFLKSFFQARPAPNPQYPDLPADRLFPEISGSWRIRGGALTLLAIVPLWLSVLSPSPAFANPAPALSVQIASRADSVPDPLVGLRVPRQRNRNSLNQIYEFDHSSLGTRIPVILVPGRAEEFQHNSWWKNLHHAGNRNPLFRRNFKMYVFLYNSKEELDSQAQALTTDIRRRFGHLPRTQPLMLVTYSLGGVIAREALTEPDILDRVDTMIAIAVPFHGSPIFDPHWFSEFLNPPNRSPVRRFWDRLIYRSYMFSKSNLTHGLKWDNFDSSKPQFHPESLHIVGDQVHPTDAPFQPYAGEDAIRAKTIVYGSYMENGYTKTHQAYNPMRLPNYVLDRSVSFPSEMLGSILPTYGFTVHSVLTYMNNQMANLPTYTPEDPEGQNTHLYRFNDGAIPLSSMMFLKARKEPYAEDLDLLTKAAETRGLRIFVNMDHLHLGEYSLPKKKLIKPDMLHPEEGPRRPFEWVIYDLIQRRNSDAFQAIVRPAAPSAKPETNPAVNPAPSPTSLAR